MSTSEYPSPRFEATEPLTGAPNVSLINILRSSADILAERVSPVCGQAAMDITLLHLHPDWPSHEMGRTAMYRVGMLAALISEGRYVPDPTLLVFDTLALATDALNQRRLN